MFKYSFSTHGNGFYILTENKISEAQQTSLRQIFKSFPHTNNPRDSIQKFIRTDFSCFDKQLVELAANAYDHYHNTVLGITCEDGYSVDAVQKLIGLGAKLDTPDKRNGKLALHWAICNKGTVDESTKNTYEAIAVLECLLQNGADPSITCYDKSTPLEYAENRGYILAAKLLENYQSIRDATLFMMCLLHDDFFLSNMPPKINSRILDFIVGKRFSEFVEDTKGLTQLSFFSNTIQNKDGTAPTQNPEEPLSSHAAKQ